MFYRKKAKEGDFSVLSDADCSNHAKGKRKLSTDIQIELSKLTLEEIIERLKSMNIRNLAISVDALRLLIKSSSLPKREKEALLKNYQADQELISWMGNYVPASKIKKPIIPADRKVAMQYGEIKLTEEYSWLVYILKPALMEANIRKYSMNDFVKVLDIDAVSNSLQEGQLEYWQFEGAIDSIISLLKKLNFLMHVVLCSNLSEFLNYHK